MNIRLFTIPNLVTLANLLCGAFAAVAALAFGDLVLAFWLVIAAAAFDFLDGFVARLLRQSSPIGLQLDSLADDISFGFVPAAVLYCLYERSEGLWLPDTGYAGLAVFLFAAFAALRLARFNIDDTQHSEFRGMPTPAATLFCISLGLLSDTRGLALTRETLLLTAVVLSLLMVSPVRMFALKFKGFRWRGNRLRYLFILVSVAMVVLLGAWAIPAIIALYVLVSLVRWIACRKGCEKG